MPENENSNISFNSTKEIIQDIKLGKMVILLDDEGRENEGDLIMAAHHVTAEDINFMAKYGRGLICMPMSQQRCEKLQLPLMVQQNESTYSTNFTISIEAASGVTTGISCADRATTIKTAANEYTKPTDLVQPGHIFPLMAKPGGVLVRAGHTEAVVDLVNLAGLGDSGVLVEILNEDGTMARRKDLEIFAKKHKLKIGTIADLIHYRLAHQQNVKEIQRSSVQTAYGTFDCAVFVDSINKQTHVALIKGEIDSEQVTAVRVHAPNIASDLLGIKSNKNENNWDMDKAMQYLQRQQSGILLVLGKNIHTTKDIVSAMGELKSSTVDNRLVGIGSQILKALNVKKVSLLSNAQRYYALSGFGLEVSEILHQHECF